mmetsp:Transcript_20682/g.61243  ORF Transcript_20682/g.61243 Transcript_20682/m.61243 type:complete len:201 (-) Transcript_20682:1728-2330(-)
MAQKRVGGRGEEDGRARRRKCRADVRLERGLERARVRPLVLPLLLPRSKDVLEGSHEEESVVDADAEHDEESDADHLVVLYARAGAHAKRRGGREHDGADGGASESGAGAEARAVAGEEEADEHRGEADPDGDEQRRVGGCRRDVGVEDRVGAHADPHVRHALPARPAAAHAAVQKQAAHPHLPSVHLALPRGRAVEKVV